MTTVFGVGGFHNKQMRFISKHDQTKPYIHSKARVLSPQRQNGLPLGSVTIIAKVTNGGASARKTNGHHSLFLPFKKSHKCCERIYLTHASEKFHDSHEKKGKIFVEQFFGTCHFYQRCQHYRARFQAFFTHSHKPNWPGD